VIKLPEEPIGEVNTFGGQTKDKWLDIILKEKDVVDKLIIQAGQDNTRKSIFMLKASIDSWEASMVNYVSLSYSQKEIDEINKKIDSSFKSLLSNWTIEQYTNCIVLIIEKKSILVKTLFPYLTQLNFFIQS
jgi:hypothetical protein